MFKNKIQKGNWYLNLERIQFALLLAIALCMGVFLRATSYLIGVSVFIALVYWILTPKVQKIDKSWILLFLPLFLLYLMYLFSMLYSENKEYGWYSLERKLSLLVFPIIMVGMGRNFFTEKKNKWIGFVFVIGCLCIFFQKAYFLSLGVLEYPFTRELLEQGKYQELINNIIPSMMQYLSSYPHLHPAFEALYMVLAFAFLSVSWIQHPKWYKKTGIKIFAIFSMLCFALALLTSSSKAGQIIFVISCLIILVDIFYRKKYILAGSFCLLFVLFFGASLYFAPGVIKRMQYSITKTNHFLEETRAFKADSAFKSREITSADKNYDGSVVPRLYLLKNGFGTFIEHWVFGVGIGDGGDVFFEHYQKTQALKIVQKHPHNQYLHTAIDLGIIGLGCLSWILVAAFIRAIKTKNLLFLIFLFSVSFAFCTDSTLTIQLGIVFFSFFYCWFMAFPVEERKKKNREKWTTTEEESPVETTDTL
ncbi:MAG: O-antigen ligase family protein [Bacteroidales bacterium]